jgi:tripartite-type tricarboxylate transporter receptor subunit TctC
MRMIVRMAVVAIGLVAFARPSLGEFPERPVTIVVPFVPGGANDIVVRLLSEPLSKALGQTVVIENRGGAGGNIGAVAVAHAKPDGYTILMGSTSFSVNPSLSGHAGYDPFKDFVPIVDMVFFPCVIAVRKDMRIDTFADLLKAAKAEPGKLNYSTPGKGTLPHLAGELLKIKAGIDIVHVPFAGAGPAVQSLLTGTVEVGVLSMSVGLPQVQAGTIKALAVTGHERWPDLADVPTLAEAGYPEAAAETWQGFFAPAGTPKEAINRIARETIDILRRPDIRERYRLAGFGVTARGPDELRIRLAEEFPKWKTVIDKAGLSAEQ